MTYQTVQVDVLTETRLGVIRLDRPAMKNALSEQMLHELAAAIDILEGRTDMHAVILTGGEQCFSAGMDIGEMLQRSTQHGQALSKVMQDAWARLTACRLPLIAGVCGVAMGGGCELAMLCDIIVAAEDAQFALPEIALGLMPGAGGTQRLPRRIGLAKAMDLCLTGRFMSAQEAWQAGLVSRVVPTATVLQEALGIGQRLAGFSKTAVLQIKEVLRRTEEVPLSQGLIFETQAFAKLVAGKDAQEGMQAFTGKRPPHFNQA